MNIKNILSWFVKKLKNEKIALTLIITFLFAVLTVEVVCFIIPDFQIKTKTEIGIITEKIHEPAHIDRGVKGMVGFTVIIGNRYIPERFAICLEIRGKIIASAPKISESLYGSLEPGQKVLVTYRYQRGDEDKKYIWG